MQVEKLDAFALKQYAFTVGKTNSHFTLLTTLLSFLIVAAAVLLTLPTVSHLWLPRNQLPVAISQTLAFPDAFTATRLCFASQNPNAAVPKARILNRTLSELSFPFVSAEQMLS
jgi:hypothetical protein